MWCDLDDDDLDLCRLGSGGDRRTCIRKPAGLVCMVHPARTAAASDCRRLPAGKAGFTGYRQISPIIEIKCDRIH